MEKLTQAKRNALRLQAYEHIQAAVEGRVAPQYREAVLQNLLSKANAVEVDADGTVALTTDGVPWDLELGLRLYLQSAEVLSLCSGKAPPSKGTAEPGSQPTRDELGRYVASTPAAGVEPDYQFSVDSPDPAERACAVLERAGRRFERPSPPPAPNLDGGDPAERAAALLQAAGVNPSL